MDSWRSEAAADLRLRRRGLKAIDTTTCGREMKREYFSGGEPLSPMARMFHEPSSNVYILAIMGSKTAIDPQVIKDNLPHTLLKHPRFSSLQVLEEETGRMKWVPTGVDIDKHVIVIPSITTLDHTACDNNNLLVENYISDLSKTTLDMERPMWDLHLLNVKTVESEGVAVLRMHHSLGDGTSLVSLLLACMRKTADPKALPTIPGGHRPPKGGGELAAARWLWLRKVWNTAADVLMFVATALFLEDTHTPLRSGRRDGSPEGAGSGARRFVHRTVSLGDVKLVKNAMNTSTLLSSPSTGHCCPWHC